ncbi:hypothetical protein TrLO_g1803 [Triparma laevis f. longispina]|uniref:Uncharacterized protein n=1 Tax=Triparma laevis f. longispina TaxID=1714387 RepID=A0A9W7AF04_9STRA|nr:hypothetical protein TrLO_g1803 [Triparma laevis f. longispina]
MSKSVASESNEHTKHLETGEEMGVGDEGGENGEGFVKGAAAESLSTLTTVSTAPAPVDDFMNTIEFTRLFAPFIHEQTLMALRVLNKEWNVVADAIINEGVRSGELIVHDGKNVSYREASDREERRKLVTWVVFLLNVTDIGNYDCLLAVNLVVVEIPEGVESIELKSMAIPNSLQTFDDNVFKNCSKLVPYNINASSPNAVVAYLRSKQQPVVSERIKQEKTEARARRLQQRKKKEEEGGDEEMWI